ncbi:unnamed protein product [Oikopleura dioica]|uniref:C-type lectin domain-containing protein n=1 Tax=Oikopleura dioica TaxID=34765 RepID=E4X1M8_OIKDI|nr:unnamed protein product [Oikopleura dioica]
MNERTRPEASTDPESKSTTRKMDYYSSTSAGTKTTASFTDSSVTHVTTDGLTTADQMSSTDYFATTSPGSDVISTSKSPDIISSAETTTEQSFSTTEKTMGNCIEKVWFVAQEENNLHYDVIKQNCADKASENNATFGYPAFFNSPEEFEQFKSSVPHRKEYIGYELHGNNAKENWRKADGSEIEYENWDIGQPDQNHETCAQINWGNYTNYKWHDTTCGNDDKWCNNAYYSCRFEIICPVTTTKTSSMQMTTTRDATITPLPTKIFIPATITTIVSNETDFDIRIEDRPLKTVWIWGMTTEVVSATPNAGHKARWIPKDELPNGHKRGKIEFVHYTTMEMGRWRTYSFGK